MSLSMKIMNRESGFSLLEVLITIVILAVGLLGLAGLTASSMRNSYGAHHRTQAVWLAYDIIDRMRANPTAALTGAYNIALTAPAPTGGTVPQQDLNQWRTQLAALPAGTGSVTTLPGGVATRFRVTIQWDDSRAEGSNAQQSNAQQFTFTVDTQL